METKYSVTDLAWFSGLFEGEGSFWFEKERGRGLQMTMTDYDVLAKVQRLFGGNLTKDSRASKKEHWKDAWRWSLKQSDAVVLVAAMLPYLGSRRSVRANEFLAETKARANVIAEKENTLARRREQIFLLRDTEKITHREIASRLGMDRSHVTHILNGRGK